MIDDYFEDLEETILDFKGIIKSYTIFKKVYNSKMGYIKGDIVLTNNSHLCFVEVKNTEFKPKEKYRYHYMDKDQGLLFRYDNACHYQELSTFPHHKHTGDGVSGSQEPELYTILIEIQKTINLEKKCEDQKDTGQFD